MREEKGFEYSDERCKELAKKIKKLVDGSTVYADFLNNGNLKSKLDNDLKILLFKHIK
jgi:type I restriction enzyme R subunit